MFIAVKIYYIPEVVLGYKYYFKWNFILFKFSLNGMYECGVQYECEINELL